jgi:hypothetical protein
VFADYVNVYLVTLQDQPEVFAKLAERMTKEELIEVTKALIKLGPRQNNAQRNAPRASMTSSADRAGSPAPLL